MGVPTDEVADLTFFQGLPSWAVQILAARSQRVRLPGGEWVVHQHDEAQAVFVLLSGTLQFLLRFEGVDELVVGATSERGSLVGWSVFRPPYRHTATVRCQQPCQLLQVPRSAFDEVFGRDQQLHYEVLGRVAAVAAERLRQTRRALRTRSVALVRWGE